jgi:hypothetical protein
MVTCPSNESLEQSSQGEGSRIIVEGAQRDMGALDRTGSLGP